MKIAGVVILYYPDNSINENIYSYISHVQKLYIVDNSEKRHEFLLSQKIVESAKVHYFTDGSNHGIAECLNKICRLAIKEGYSWLLTMDQDSSFTTGILKQYLSQIQHFEQYTSVAMFGVQHFGTPVDKEESSVFEEVSTLITSGSVINLDLFIRIGGFDENLFIDEVDLEYCLRAVDNEFKVIRCTNIYLNHKLGIESKYRSLKNFKVTLRTLHAPVRIYYMVRNYLYVYSKFRNKFKAELQISRKALLNRLKNNILYNPERLKVLQFICRGVMDFRKNKMGKLNL